MLLNEKAIQDSEQDCSHQQESKEIDQTLHSVEQTRRNVERTKIRIKETIRLVEATNKLAQFESQWKVILEKERE